MGHVFISYKREDLDVARNVRLALRAEFQDLVWWDQDLVSGDQWSQELDEKLSSASCVVVLWSKLSVQSQWVQQEAAVAKALGTLAPARIDDCELPAPYAGIQAACLTDWQGDEKDVEFAKLVSRVKACRVQHRWRSIKKHFGKLMLGSLLAGLSAGFFAHEPILKAAQFLTVKADPNERVLHYKAQILALRGDIEAEEGKGDNAQDTDLRQRGLQLADLIGEIDEGQLTPAIKIIKHEYRGWAFLMGVSTFAEQPPQNITAESRIDYATKAVAEFDLALGLMADITRDFRASVPAAIPIYEWMTGTSEDVNRTHYLKAVALAVIARAGGGLPQAAIAELREIKPAYLMDFPAESNPDLEWALQQTSSAKNDPQ